MGGGQSSYQKAGTNFDRINGSQGHIINALDISAAEVVLISANENAVIDFIDIYTEAGAIQLYFEDGSGKKAWVKAGVPGKLFYPGRYGLDITGITASAQGITVGSDPGSGCVTAFSSDAVDQTTTIP
jgi:hypothetical protein